MSLSPPAAKDPTPPGLRAALQRGRPWSQKVREGFIEFLLLCCGLFSIMITVGIALVVLFGSIRFFLDPNVSVSYFFTGTEWTPGFENPKYGILPLLTGTLMVAAIAAALALPVGLITAVYLSEYASPRVRSFAKPALELLAGIPTVVYGFFALTVVTPFLATFVPGLNEPTNQLAGGIVVGIMILPMVASLSEDAIRAVPRSLREASYALGADQFDTSVRVIVPAALSGVLASFVLAISRAIGETMAVTLACGSKPQLTLDPREGLATMTSFIVGIAQGDVAWGSTQFNSLFAVAGVLFVITLLMNIFSQWMLGRYRQVYQ